MSSDINIIVFTAVLSALTSSGVMSLIIYLLQRRDRIKEKEETKNSAQSKMLLGLGHDRIIHLTDAFVRRGAITLKEKRNLKFLCDPYFGLEGNGDAKIGYLACNELPVVSEDEAATMDAHIYRKELGYEDE